MSAQPSSDDVSVIITSYNQQDLLREAIDSVIEQTALPGEILVIDAASTDDSQDLIREYEGANPDLVRPVLLEEDPGIPRTRNRALKLVDGDYVAILDGDDRFLPHKIEREISTLRDNPNSKAIYSNYFIIDYAGERVSRRYAEPQPSGEIFADVFDTKFGMLRSMLIEYDTFEEIEFLDTDFWHYDGFDFCIEIAKRHELEYVHEPLSEYRRHPGGAAAWRQPSDLLPELEGIYQKHHGDLDRVSRGDRRRIQHSWRALLAVFAAGKARQQGHYGNAIWEYLRVTRYDPFRVLNYKRVLNKVLPDPIYDRIRSLYWTYKSGPS